jgi:deoxycytidylate deaminase
MAHIAASMSKDASFKAGAVVVAADRKRLLSTAYNGPPPAMADDLIDQTDRPLVRALTMHAESNALWFAAKSHNSEALKGGHLYVNGRPCHRCVAEMVRAELYACVYDDTNPSQPKMVDAAEWSLSLLAASKGNLLLIPYSELKGN